MNAVAPLLAGALLIGAVRTVLAFLEPGPAGWTLLRNMALHEVLTAQAALLVFLLVRPLWRGSQKAAAATAFALLAGAEVAAHFVDQRFHYALVAPLRLALFSSGFALAAVVAPIVWRFGRRFEGVVLAVQSLVLLTGIVAAAASWPRAGSERALPDVVLVVLDAVQVRALGVGGSPFGNSPGIDALADRGLVATGAFASAATSVPGHASILAGLGVSEHRAPTNDYDLPEELPPFLAERLRARGYRTFGFCHNPLVSRRAGFARGFDHYWNWGERRVGDAPVPLLLLQWPAAHLAMKASRIDPVGLAARWGLAEARGPAFTFLQLLYTHSDYVDGDGWATPERVAAVAEAYRQGRYSNRTGYPLDEVAEFHARYLGAVAYSDRIVSEVLDRVRRRAGERGVVVMVTADHGENLAEHGDDSIGRHHGPWSTSLRIPLVLDDSRAPLARRFDGLTSQERFASVLLDRAVEAVENARDPETLLAQSTHFAYSHPWLVSIDDSLKVAIDRTDFTRPPEVHRWREDFEDRHPLDPASHERAARMWQELLARYEQLRDTGFFEAPAAVRADKLEDLRALGYIE